MRTADHCTYVTSDNKSIRRMLRVGDIDVAYAVSSLPGSEEFASRYDRSGRLHLMVNRSSPLAARASVRVSDLRGLPFVSQGAGYDLHEALDTRCRREGFELGVHYTAPSFFELALQVNDDLGAAYFPLASVSHYDMPDVVCVPFEEDGMDWFLLHLVKKDSDLCGVEDEYWDTRSGFPSLRGDASAGI